VKETQSYQTLL